MSIKEYEIPEYGTIKLYKRKGAKMMRLSISHEGEVKLTMPKWAPYSSGIVFINKNRQWIESHQVKRMPIFTNNLRVGKSHTLNFVTNQNIVKVSTKIHQNIIKVSVPFGSELESEPVQNAAKKACLRALKLEAEKLLPMRLETLANNFGFEYSKVKIKQLRSRWGSCNSLKEIALSFYLMQLPWELIDYVILHELTHTKVMAHGVKFWTELEQILPNAKDLRKEVNKFKPVIDTSYT